MTLPAVLPANPLEPITVTLDPRLIAELPRFFGGFQPMLRELFQNAYRAGAEHVTITSGVCTMVFTDDGRGITSPEILFRAGATGWNEQEVIAPAGLGVFSLLNPSIVSSLTIRSRNWEVSTTPRAALALEPITPQPAPDIAGTEISMVFINALKRPDELKNALTKARGLYPFAVTWNGQALPAPIHPRDQHQAITITIPDGEVSLSETSLGLIDLLTSRSGVVWEHRPISALYSDNQQDALERAITSSYLLFTPNTTCDVRPKLPDRDRIEDNQAWTDTKHRIIEALKLELIARATRETLNWNAEFKLGDIIKGELSGVSEEIARQLLPILGYHACDTQTAQLQSMYNSQGDDGIEFEDLCVTYFTKDALLVNDHRAELVGNALVELGISDHSNP